ncbi:ParB/RepB/Spo0J family partition protein [Streptomyces achromogenes]|uniref:ParB/RepB/Spo0J family partition protein n=1 Tax=Streptomyces achromogenes TaxID=67255 RepID=UPI0036F5FF94
MIVRAQSVHGGPADGVSLVPLATLEPADSPRAGEIDEVHVRRLAAARTFPPIVVHRGTMRVIDGMHRMRAAALLGRDGIEVRYFDGTPAEAFVLAVQLNVRHGLQLSRAERTAAAERIVASHPAWSDRAIAAAAGLSVKTVAQLRQRSTSAVPQLHARVGLDGRVRPVNAADGRRRAADFIRGHPDASLRQIAAAAGIAVGTARSVRLALERGESPEPAPRSAQVSTARSPDPGAGAGGVLAQLCRDPAFRFSASSRLLLRLLDNRMLAGRGADHVLHHVPAHGKDALATAVRQCIDTWNKFLRKLEEIPGEQPPERAISRPTLSSGRASVCTREFEGRQK